MIGIWIVRLVCWIEELDRFGTVWFSLIKAYPTGDEQFPFSLFPFHFHFIFTGESYRALL